MDSGLYIYRMSLLPALLPSSPPNPQYYSVMQTYPSHSLLVEQPSLSAPPTLVSITSIVLTGSRGGAIYDLADVGDVTPWNPGCIVFEGFVARVQVNPPGVTFVQPASPVVTCVRRPTFGVAIDMRNMTTL